MSRILLGHHLDRPGLRAVPGYLPQLAGVSTDHAGQHMRVTISDLVKACSHHHGGHGIPEAINSPGQPAGARSFLRAHSPGHGALTAGGHPPPSLPDGNSLNLIRNQGND